MIISHKYKFIFVKTLKTAGTSQEVFLASHCGADDIITTTYPPVEGHQPRNYKGAFWPFPEMLSFNYPRDPSIFCEKNYFRPGLTWRDFRKRRRFYEHIPARILKYRVDPKIWDTYHKFCFERNPWDKTLSHYHMHRHYRMNPFVPERHKLRAEKKGVPLKALEGKRTPLTLDEYFERGHYCLNFPYYTDQHDQVMVDQIIKYENMTEEFGALCDRLGIPFNGSLGVRAKAQFRSDRRPGTEVFTPAQVERIGKIYKKEIDLLGYRFGE